MDTHEITPFDQQANTQLIANPDSQSVRYADIVKQMMLSGVPISAKQLVDSTFTIIRARQFESSFKEDSHAYFCVIKPEDSPEIYSVVLGGGAVVEVLDAIIASGFSNPLTVTLRFKEGGKFNGYYFFE